MDEPLAHNKILSYNPHIESATAAFTCAQCQKRAMTVWRGNGTGPWLCVHCFFPDPFNRDECPPSEESAA